MYNIKGLLLYTYWYNTFQLVSRIYWCKWENDDDDDDGAATKGKTCVHCITRDQKVRLSSLFPFFFFFFLLLFYFFFLSFCFFSTYTSRGSGNVGWTSLANNHHTQTHHFTFFTFIFLLFILFSSTFSSSLLFLSIFLFQSFSIFFSFSIFPSNYNSLHPSTSLPRIYQKTISKYILFLHSLYNFCAQFMFIIRSLLFL